jgi:hypothetical protein
MKTCLITFGVPPALFFCTTSGFWSEGLDVFADIVRKAQGEQRGLTFLLKPCCFCFPFPLAFLSALAPECASR